MKKTFTKHERTTKTYDELFTHDMNENDYYEYALSYDEQNETNYAEIIIEMCKRRVTNEIKRNDNDDMQRVEINGQRNIIGNYNNNDVMIEKTFTHLNSLKRSMSLSFQSDNEQTKLFHENNMFKQLLNLELSLRTMKKNIKHQK